MLRLQNYDEIGQTIKNDVKIKYFPVDNVNQPCYTSVYKVNRRGVNSMGDTLLTGGEWHVMRELWAESPQTLMQLVGKLAERVGWAKSTTITTLRRMEAKGLVAVEQTERGKSYTPLVDEKDAAVSETRSFLDRVYAGSVGLMVSALAEREELSDAEIAELRDILRRAEEKRHD